MGGISSIIGAVALLGFLLFIAGIALVVVSASQGRPVRGGITLAVFGLIAGVVLSIISQGIIVVSPTQVAVVINTFSGEVLEPRTGGTHIIIPVVQSVPIVYSTAQQEYTMSGVGSEGAGRGDDAVETLTKDGQVARVEITLLFRVDPNSVRTLYRVYPEGNYATGYVRPQARSVARDIVALFAAEELYGAARTEMGDQMEEVLKQRFTVVGLELTDLLVRDINFSQEFTEAIERKQVAEQDTLREEIRVRQTEQEAAQRRAEAAGERDARIARAEGDAQAIILNARAQAQALSLVSEQLAANPLLLQYEYIQSLADNISLALIPSNSPFLFDFNSLEGLPSANSDFTAPAVPDTEDIVAPTTEGSGN